MTGRCLEVQQTSVEGEILLLSGVLALDLVRHLSSEKLSKSTVVIFQMLQPLCGESDDQLTLLGYNPMAIHQILQGNVTVFQHTGLHDDFLLLSGMLLDQPRVISLGPWHHRVISMGNLQTESASNSSLSPTRLSASATLLSAPQRYSMVKLNPTRDATQRCPTASRLGVDIT